jgi:muramidase (phage lysozyme)
MFAAKRIPSHTLRSHALIAVLAIWATGGCLTGDISDGDSAADGDDDVPDQNAELDQDVTSSCSPSLARGAVAPFRKALLDTIAFAEGTYHHGPNDGYDVAFGFHIFPSCAQHPGVKYCSGSLCSTASGRYQFLLQTWQGLGYASFSPANQDRAAIDLVIRRGASVPTNRALNHTEFANLMNIISWEWASLPPGRYGQPSRSTAEVWNFYAQRVDTLGDAPPAPPPAPPAPPAIPPAPTACGVIQPGHGLGPGRSIASCDNRFFLSMQTDGNLVLYQRPSTALWASNTTTGYIAQMQSDGNFVVYDRRRHPIFNTITAGHNGARFQVQNDGNAVVYSTADRPLWSSRTCCR